MANLLHALSAYSMHIQVNTSLQDGGFALTYPGLLGKTVVTPPALTQRILASPEFDQLLGADKATRILELVLAQALG
jgi:hypothetical protein